MFVRFLSIVLQSMRCCFTRFKNNFNFKYIYAFDVHLTKKKKKKFAKNQFQIF